MHQFLRLCLPFVPSLSLSLFLYEVFFFISDFLVASYRFSMEGVCDNGKVAKEGKMHQGRKIYIRPLYRKLGVLSETLRRSGEKRGEVGVVKMRYKRIGF